MNIKITLLGDEYVGKTCLINGLTDDEFPTNETSTTIGCSFSNLKLNIENKNYDCTVWDTPGKKKYRDFCKLLIEDSNIILLVYSIIDKSSFINLQNFYKFCKAKTNTILGIIGNKSKEKDLETQEEVTEEEGKLYAEKIGAMFALTSAKNDIISFKDFLKQLVIDYINKKKAQIEESEEKKRKGSLEDIEKRNREDTASYLNKNINYYNINFSKIIRCEKCHQIPKIDMKDNSKYLKLICENCQYYKDILYEFYEDHIKYLQQIQCDKCKNPIKNFKEVSYDINEKNYICKTCLKKIKQDKEIKTLNYNEMDSICEKHLLLKNYLYKNKLVCPLCNKNFTEKLTEDKMKEKLERIKSLLKEKEDFYKNLDKYFNDTINRINFIYKNYRKHIASELAIQKDLFNHFDNIKYNQNLYDIVNNYDFSIDTSIIDSEKYETWDKRLEKIFLIMKEPIEVKYFKIQDENVFLKNLDLHDFINPDNEDLGIKMTDVTYLKNKNYAVSFNNGNIRIFNNQNKTMQTIKLYENLQGINSLLAYTTSKIEILVTTGYEKIYFISFSDNYNKYDLFKEITEKDEYFNNIKFLYNKKDIDYMNLIASTNTNKIFIYNLNKNKKIEIVDELFLDKDILYLDFINETKFYIGCEEEELYTLRSDTLMPNSDNENQKAKNSEFIIFDIDNNNKVINGFSIKNSLFITGLDKDNILIVRMINDDNYYLSLHDCIKNNEIKLIDLEEKPICCKAYNSKDNYYFILIVDANLNIIQFIFDLYKHFIYPIKEISNKTIIEGFKNSKINNENIKLIYSDNTLKLIFNYGQIIDINF